MLEALLYKYVVRSYSRPPVLTAVLASTELLYRQPWLESPLKTSISYRIREVGKEAWTLTVLLTPVKYRLVRRRRGGEAILQVSRFALSAWRAVGGPDIADRAWPLWVRPRPYLGHLFPAQRAHESSLENWCQNPHALHRSESETQTTLCGDKPRGWLMM